MSNPLSAVIFDLDGTLIDTREDLHGSVNALRESYGLTPLPMERTVAAIGHGVEHLVATVLNTTSVEEIGAAATRFVEHYQAHCTEKSEPYPGIARLLRELRSEGIKVGVLTNKPQASAERLVAELELAVDAVIGAAPDRPTKPDPSLLRMVAEALDADLRRSIYVGDMLVDLETARASDCAFVGVDFGFTKNSELPTRTAVCVDTDAALRRALLLRD